MWEKYNYRTISAFASGRRSGETEKEAEQSPRPSSSEAISGKKQGETPYGGQNEEIGGRNKKVRTE